MIRPKKYMRGIGLLEGLVAVAVLAVGMLALFSFQADVLNAGAESKARTEALQLAENRLGELRDRANDFAQFAALGGDPRTNFETYLATEAASQPVQVQGTNAVFSVDTVYPGTGTRPSVNVIVSWPAPGGATESITAGAEIGLKDPASGVLLASTDPSGGGIPRPTGLAEYGAPGETRPDLVAGGTPNGDGTISARDTATNTYYLLDSSGTVLIKSKSRPLARISGAVYVTAAMNFERAYIKVGAPDVSWCTTIWNPNDPLLRIKDADVPVYDKLPYNCYVGAGWYGSIGPLAYEPDPNAVFDPSNTNPTFIRSEFGPNDKSCVGDDDAAATFVDVGGTPTVTAESRHPQLSFTRMYRGYTQLRDPVTQQPVVDAQGNYLFGSQGIVLPVDANGDPQPIWITDHDFVLATINNAQDSDCGPRLAVGDETDNPVDETPVTFAVNPGKFYCLTQDVGCPAVLPADTGQAVGFAVNIRGQFLDDAGTRLGTGAGITVQTDDGTLCPSSGDPAYDYECTVYALDSGWTGDIRATGPTGYVIQPRLVPFAGLTADAQQDFTRAAATPFTIYGTVNLYGGARFAEISSDSSGNCQWNTFRGSPAAGAFDCRYPGPVPLNGEVNITVAVSGQTTLCASSSGGVTSSVADTTLSIGGVTGDVSGVVLDVAKRASDCPP